ncbi:endonuclease III [Pontixanthobacter aestiaquae]|uniref:Endonuclease III n=1 Tax=Pontixanthobacter aestiaquae TaxID=1509367 RepID=A0A844Z4U8_9SPHN|nr:endonuclease III [Pontixanthobacter aestiaquae]MDN3646644.1 endonuclease III [Pontixanthobacter aestiaquae]MXO82372.1 endonuclease III [Pontixanthobacter aestiaquae]
MQLPLGSDPRTDQLERIHAALIAEFGRIERPDTKRRDPVWTLVQGVIGARTKTAVSNAATDAMLERYGSWEAVAEAPLEELTSILSNQTFPEQSARRLKESLNRIIEERGQVDLRHLSNLETADMMEWLETLPGIARKISAGIANTSVFDRRAVVLDTHHRRVMQRMGLVAPKADTTRAYDALMPVMPEEWTAKDIDEHHLLVKRLGQTSCRPTNPKCGGCPLRNECAYVSA